MVTWRSRWSLVLITTASACAQGISPEAFEDAQGPIREEDAQSSHRDAGASDAAELSDADEAPLDAGAGTADANTTSDAGRDGATALDSGEAGPADAGSIDGGTQLHDAALDAGAVDGSTPDAGPPPPDAGSITFGYVQTNLDLTGIDFAAAPSANLNCGATEIDTSAAITLRNWCGTAPKPLVRSQAGGPELAVIPLRGLSLGADASLRVIGTRPVLFVVQGNVTLRGRLDVSGRDRTPGAGGNFMCGSSVGTDGSANGSLNAAGGGGGSFASKGGNGGASEDCTSGMAGATRGNAELKPLIAGCAGGKGGGCDEAGGAGGGAVQISAAGALVVSSALHANGGNGGSGCENDSGGAGAGSGGAVLLEANTINATGADIKASGGDGGRGNGGGNGGAGAANANASGANGESSDNNGAGGGGGGHGRVRFHAIGMCTGC